MHTPCSHPCCHPRTLPVGPPSELRLRMVLPFESLGTQPAVCTLQRGGGCAQGVAGLRAVCPREGQEGEVHPPIPPASCSLLAKSRGNLVWTPWGHNAPGTRKDSRQCDGADEVWDGPEHEVRRGSTGLGCLGSRGRREEAGRTGLGAAGGQRSHRGSERMRGFEGGK